MKSFARCFGFGGFTGFRSLQYTAHALSQPANWSCHLPLNYKNHIYLFTCSPIGNNCGIDIQHTKCEVLVSTREDLLQETILWGRTKSVIAKVHRYILYLYFGIRSTHVATFAMGATLTKALQQPHPHIPDSYAICVRCSVFPCFSVLLLLVRCYPMRCKNCLRFGPAYVS